MSDCGNLDLMRRHPSAAQSAKMQKQRNQDSDMVYQPPSQSSGGATSLTFNTAEKNLPQCDDRPRRQLYCSETELFHVHVKIKSTSKVSTKKFHQLFSNSCHKNVQIPKFSVNSAARCILQGRFSYNAEKNMELDRLPHLKSAAP